MDVIEQILGDLRQESCVFCRLEAGEPWRIQKSGSPVAPFYVVLAGSAQVCTAGGKYSLEKGDFLVLPNGNSHELRSMNGADTTPVPLLELFADAGIEPWRPGIRFRAVRLKHGGSGPQSIILVGLFFFGDGRTNPLLKALPPVLVTHEKVHEGAGGGARTIVDAIENELDSDGPASSLVVAKLVDLLWTQSLRAYLAGDVSNSVGWLRGIADGVVGRAIAAMHAEPSRPWTLQSLAEQAGCSRAAFAARFRSLVGQGALGYLTAWRMHIAASLLLEGRNNVAMIANCAGYRSEAAFSKSFKRWSGFSPSRYRLHLMGNARFATTKEDGSRPKV